MISFLYDSQSNKEMETTKEGLKFFVYSQNSSLQCLRRYGRNTMNALKSLERLWEFAGQDQNFFSDLQVTMVKVNTLFRSYELMVIEFEEYCEALQIPQLGKCFLKIFVQMMSILERTIASHFKYMEDLDSTRPAGRLCQDCQQNINRKQGIKPSDKQYFAQRERNNFQAHHIQIDINRIEQQYKTESQQQHLLSQNWHESFAKVISIESSNAEHIIQQAISQISHQNTNLIHFMKSRNKLLREQPNQVPNNFFQTLKEEMAKDKQSKNGVAVQKLYQLFIKFVGNIQKENKKTFQEQQIQTDEIEMPNQERSYYQQQIYQKVRDLESAKFSIELQKNKTKRVEQLMKEKNDQYEEELLKNRVFAIKIEKELESVNVKLKMEEAKNLRIIEKSQRYSTASYASNLSNAPNTKQTEDEQKLTDTKENPSKTSYYALRRSNKRRQKPNFRPQFDDLPDTSQQLTKMQSIPQNTTQNTQKLNVNLTLQSAVHEFEYYKCKKQQFCDQQVNLVVCKPQTSIECKTFKNFRELSLYSNRYELMINPTIKSAGDIENKQNRLPSQFKMSESTNLLRKKRNIHNIFSMKRPVASRKQTQVNTMEQREQNQLSAVNNISQIQQIKKYDSLYIGSKFKPVNHSNDHIKPNNCGFKVKIKPSKENKINFDSEDLEQLFFDKSKAMDFQLINFNLGSYRKQAESVDCIRSLKYTSHNKKQGDRGQIQRQEFISSIIFRQINSVKFSQPKKYESIRNFLRYPYSTTNRQNKDNNKLWSQLSEKDEGLQMRQVKKIYCRLQKLHEKCIERDHRVRLCVHLKAFLDKLGIVFA